MTLSPAQKTLLALSFVAATVLCAFTSEAVDVYPEEDTNTALFLPDAGYSVRIWGSAQENYFPRASSFSVYRSFDEYGLKGEGVIPYIKDWMNMKRYVGFSMQCSNDKMLPKGLNVESQYSNSEFDYYIQGKTPFYWSDKYMDALCEWVEAMGDALGDNPYLVSVGVCGIGYGGSLVVYPDDLPWWTPHDAPFKDFGYTEEKRIEMLWRLIRTYRDAFPMGVRLGMSLDIDKDVMKETWDEWWQFYVDNNVSVGFGLCGEGVMGFHPDGKPVGGGPNKGKAMEEDTAPDWWESVPVGLGGAFNTMEWEKDHPGHITSEILRRGMFLHPMGFSYADGDGYARRFEADPVKVKLLDHYGLEYGYRIAVKKASYGASARQGTPLTVEMEIANSGAAPMYADRQLEVSFHSVSSTAQLLGAAAGNPEPSSKTWMPHSTNTVTLTVQVPRSAPRGTYDMAIALRDHDPRREGNLLQMAMKDKVPGENRYILGRISIGN